MKPIPVKSYRYIILGLALVGCGGANQEQEVASPPSGILLVPVADFGPELHGGQVEQGGLALGPDGTVVVVHAVARQVFVLTPGSERVAALGREGAGPGEFSGPRVVATTEDGVVAVFDRALLRLSFWNPAGSMLEERHFSRDVMAMYPEGTAVLVKMGRETGLQDGSFSILRVVPGREEPEVLLEQGTSTPAEGPIPLDTPLPQVCWVCPFFRLPSGEWVFQPAGFTDQVVRVGTDRRVQVVWSRGRLPEPMSRGEWLEEGLRMREQARALISDRSQIPVSGAVLPAFDSTLRGDPPLRRGLSSRGSIGLDGRGRLWTLPSLPPEASSLLEVQDESGTFLGAFTLEQRPVQMASRGEWLALVFEDDVGLATVRLFRIEDL